MPVSIIVPDGLTFESLNVGMNEEGVQFNMDVVEQLLSSNDLDPRDFRSAASLAGLIGAWYFRERAFGAARSPMVERLICGAGGCIDDFVFA